ncbi:CotH kinase family protein [Microbacterium sp. KSW4-11]|uniref:CotH kinase family protein n=1 Tax=Microbacterium gawkjiense TaxID=3067309 RepID=A0ABU3G918_9MICO|nr:CotH kinase family protein [Microbacterium sp. KSW4-11]MDT3316025.1 CotH kinase family protein [Microbacterium sp. KSW4-11]
MRIRHLRLALSLALVSAGAVVLAGCVAPATDEREGETDAARLSTSTASFWDSSTVHSISVDVDDDTLAELLETYESTGDKEWIEVTVTIDGEVYEGAGLKLKGNSSLKSVTSDDDPSGIPWIIRLDKFVDGQNHEGITDFVVRGNSSETSLNEAVALDLLDLAGLASEQAAATRFTIAGSTALRLVVENPGDSWNDSTLGATALYKAESGGDYSYRGDDPESYTDVFDQEAGDDDLAPLISFLKFINDSDDETFSAELSQHLDVTEFATYLAFQDVVDNFDDIDGPGNNSYLAYDADTGLMTVVNWDLNLAFGASPGGAGAGGAGGDGMAMPDRGDAVAPDRGDVGAPEGDARADRPTLPGDDEGAQMGGGGGRGGSNTLASRFLADEDFHALYESELEELEDLFYGSGAAEDILQTWSDALVAGAGDLVDADVIAADAADLTASFERLAD